MKRIIAIALVVVLALTLGTGLALAKGPGEKATGTVSLGPPVVGWHAEFNAHEEIDGRPAKGSMRTWNDAAGRYLNYDVKYVIVDSDEAWFAAKCTYDSSTTDNRVGRWLFVKVLDVGSPGSNGDYIGWDWNSGTNETAVAARVSAKAAPTNWWTVIDGNLVVHS